MCLPGGRRETSSKNTLDLILICLDCFAEIPKRVMPVVQDDTLLLEILALFRSGKGVLE